MINGTPYIIYSNNQLKKNDGTYKKEKCTCTIVKKSDTGRRLKLNYFIEYKNVQLEKVSMYNRQKLYHAQPSSNESNK